MADLTEKESGQTIKIVGSDLSGNETYFADVDSTGKLLTTTEVVTNTLTQAFSSFSPDPLQYDTQSSAPIQSDYAGNIQIRGQVLSDEGSFRDGFIGSSLTTTLTGTLNFTNGSDQVTGTGTLFLSELVSDVAGGIYIKKTADSETLYVKVSSRQSDTALTLESPYAGTTASSTAVKSNWVTTTASGGTLTVSSSNLSLSSGTTNGGFTSIQRFGDYLPYNLSVKCAITQRIANQTTVIGFQDDQTTPVEQAVFVFDGTTNTTVKCRTSISSAAGDIEETTVTLPSSAVTSSQNIYQIDLSAKQTTFSINGKVLAIHKNHMPRPYSVMAIVASMRNAAIVTSTTLQIDSFYFSNVDQVQIANDFTGQPLKVALMGSQQGTGLPIDLNLDANGNLIVTALTGFNANFNFGDINTAATTIAAVRRTAYTEQTTNAQRSIASASANDTAAGTGARTVEIKYLDSTGAGPYTETITLNGTTYVNTVATNICYIEKIRVLTVGSGGSNAGILTLKAATAGGGATIGTIKAGDNQTFWAHHYIPTSREANITGISCSHNGTTVGSGGVFTMRAKSLSLTNAVEIQVSDFVRLYGQSSTFGRNYQSPIKITGPARLIMYVTPETASATVYRTSFDYFEP